MVVMKSGGPSMKLSSAEKYTDICPWKFPDPEKANNNNLDYDPEFVARSTDTTQEGMGNVNLSSGRSDVGPVSSNPIDNTNIAKSINQRNEVNANKQGFQTPLPVINGTNDIYSKTTGTEKAELIMPTNANTTEKSPIRENHSETMLNGNSASIEKIRLTMDVNNSRPSSRSNTPVLNRKFGSNRKDQHVTDSKSSSSGSLKDSQAEDIMISYSHLDKDIMLKLKEALEASGISVWVDVVGLNAGVNFLHKIGQAIIDSKMFITLLTERTVASKFCQDELALAYISNKPIFPVSLKPQEEIFPEIPTGMKLQLARFTWTQISMDNFDADFKVLHKRLRECLADIDGIKDEGRDVLPPISPDRPLTRKPVLKKRSTRNKLYNKPNRSLSRCNSIIEDTCGIDTAEFWDRNFKDQKSLPWESFETAFMRDYEKQLNMTYSSNDRDWFIDILKRELEATDGVIRKDKYKEFISEEIDGKMVEQPILKCVNDLAVENYTMKEVFNMDSSVRLDAINHLAKFGSVEVVEALLDLLDDQEHDVRASACISLAKSKAGCLDMKIERLKRCLRDTDRFVRESACVALGYLKADSAVPALLQIWRNDYISSVREAAELALQQIGGAEVNRAMQMTKVLTAEIQDLIKVLTGTKTSPKSSAPKKWAMKAYTLPQQFNQSPNLQPTTLQPPPAGNNRHSIE